MLVVMTPLLASVVHSLGSKSLLLLLFLSQRYGPLLMVLLWDTLLRIVVSISWWEEFIHSVEGVDLSEAVHFIFVISTMMLVMLMVLLLILLSIWMFNTTVIFTVIGTRNAILAITTRMALS